MAENDAKQIKRCKSDIYEDVDVYVNFIYHVSNSYECEPESTT